MSKSLTPAVKQPVLHKTSLQMNWKEKKTVKAFQSSFWEHKENSLILIYTFEEHTAQIGLRFVVLQMILHSALCKHSVPAAN